MKIKTKVVQARISERLLERFDEARKHEGVSRSDVIVQAIRDFVNEVGISHQKEEELGLSLSDETLKTIGHYEAAVIDYVNTENDVAVVDYDAVLEGLEDNGLDKYELSDKQKEAIVNEVHRSLKVRGESTEAIDFIPEGANYRDADGEWKTARRELVIPKEWNRD